MNLNRVFHVSEDMVLILPSTYDICEVTINITSESASIQNCSSAINVFSIKQSCRYYSLLFNSAVGEKKRKKEVQEPASLSLTVHVYSVCSG